MGACVFSLTLSTYCPQLSLRNAEESRQVTRLTPLCPNHISPYVSLMKESRDGLFSKNLLNLFWNFFHPHTLKKLHKTTGTTDITVAFLCIPTQKHVDADNSTQVHCMVKIGNQSCSVKVQIRLSWFLFGIKRKRWHWKRVHCFNTDGRRFCWKDCLNFEFFCFNRKSNWSDILSYLYDIYFNIGI